ncbi:MAG TPA: carboxypeptidase-like regulatory domain-containing protein [Candidatus Acidoferrales bacterium]|nr:carboxypeptidase-like regulatory domain-containing protein [Candidatus Acidoferrales bacterium]
MGAKRIASALVPVAVAALAAALLPGAGRADDSGYFLTGRVVAAESGRPLAGVAVAIAPDDNADGAPMAGDQPPTGLETAAVTRTDSDGRFSLPLPPSYRYLLDAYGRPFDRATFHGDFAGNVRVVDTLKLTAPNPDERAALAQINRFREDPGGKPQLATHWPTLVFDENLMESARFWAHEEKRAGRIGHTCAALGRPSGCIEFNAFFHQLPGAPLNWDAGQNAAFDTVPSWSDPNEGFEDEGLNCRPAFDWRRCGRATSDETGHFINVMTARQWAGFGESQEPGVGTYYALNII